MAAHIESRPRPFCHACSRRATNATGAVASVRVDRFLVFRGDDGRMHMIAHCHGQTLRGTFDVEPRDETELASYRCF